MSYWAKAAIDRDQIALIPTTLSDRIPEDHSVRLFWELIGTYDWRAWEARYCGCHGQPAIHPRIVGRMDGQNKRQKTRKTAGEASAGSPLSLFRVFSRVSWRLFWRYRKHPDGLDIGSRPSLTIRSPERT